MAYTKYSLTPANNTAAPPDGAPEGMLPSAVNDTMRDMMAQIRDCGDGIRDGTYTMTAPKITGGTITGVAFTGNTFTNPVISGGSINNTPIGATTANTGAFTTLSATGVTTVQAGTNSAPAITTSGDTNTGIFFPAADTIAFTEGGVESMRIDASGNVGLGVTPSAWDSAWKATQIGSTGFIAGRTNAERFYAGSNAYFNGTNWIYVTSGRATYYASNLSQHEWYTAGSGTAGNAITFTQAMTLDASGNVLVGITSARSNAGDVQVSKGISFPATQSAQSDANTLDDYEEGTFTPTVSGSTTAGTGTYSQQYGVYTKIGNRVWLDVWVNWTAHTGTGSLLMSGFPFQATGGTFRNAGAISYANNLALTANNAVLGVLMTPNVTSAEVTQNPVGGGTTTNVAMDTSANMHFSISYVV
jgi:hypothetical protein